MVSTQWFMGYCCQLTGTALTLAVVAQKEVRVFNYLWSITNVLQFKVQWLE